MASRIKGIVWDVGNVLVAWDPAWLYRQLIKDPVKADWWAKHSFTMEWNLLGDLGMLYAEANPLWVACFERDHKARLAEFPRYRELIEAYGRWPEEAHAFLNTDTIALRNALRKDYKTIALTNFSNENWPKVNAAHGGAIDHFDHVVMSSHEKLLKPDAKMYDRLAHVAEMRFGLKREELVFIDDSAKNIAGAKACGIHAFIFTSAEQLRHDLKTLGVETAHIPAATGLRQGAGLGRLAAMM
jgi:HAD superfamily hydrolase (TIGR01509 family)